MYQLKSLTQSSDFAPVLSQMDEIYGEQDHIPFLVLEKISSVYPDLFKAIYFNKELVGHMIILPFNEKGLIKITDLENDESDFDLSDFSLIKDPQLPVYFFVYSIYGNNHRTSFKLIQSLHGSLKGYSTEISPESTLFAECVSEQGVRISEKMGLRKYFTYTFREEELHLYKANISEFVSIGLGFKSLVTTGVADHIHS